MTRRKTSPPPPPILDQMRKLVEDAYKEGWSDRYYQSDDWLLSGRRGMDDERREADWQESYARKLLLGDK